MTKLEIFCEIVIVFLYIFAPKVRGIKDCLDLGVSQQEDFDIDKFKGTWYVLQTASTVGACMTFEIDQKETGSRSEYSLNVISLFFNSGRFLRVFFKKSAVVRKVAYRNDLFEVQMPFDINPYTFVIPFTDYDNYALLIACKSGLMSTPSQMPIIMHRIREGTPLDLDKVHNFLDENDLPRSGLTKISQSHCANNTGLYQIDIKATWFVTTVRSIKALLRILRKAKRIAQTSIYHVKRIWNISRTIYGDPWGYIDQSLNKILIPIENCLLSIYSRITILIRMIIDKINQIQDTIANSALWEKIKVSLSNAIDKIQNNYQVPSIMGRMDENTYDSPPIMDRIKNATHIDTLIDAIKNAIPNLNISSVTPSSVAALLNLFKNIGPVNNLNDTKESIPVTANVNVTSNLDSVTSSSILDKIKKSGTVTAILNKVPRIFKSRKKSYPVAALSAAIKKIKPIMDTVDKMDLDDKSSSVINDTEASTPVIEILDKNKDANPITPIPVLDDIKGSTPESTLNQVIGHIKNATHIDTIFSSLTSSFVQIKESGPIAAVLGFFTSSTPTNILSDTKKSTVTKDGTTKSSPDEVLLAAINQINPIIEAIDEINLASDAVTDISSIAYVEESTPLMEILDTNKDRNSEDVTTAFILDDRKGSTRKSTSIRATKKVTSSLGNKAKDSLPVAAMKDIFKRFIG